MCTGIAHLFYLEKLGQKLATHGSDDLVQKQVLVDGIETALYGKTSRLYHLAHHFDVLWRVFNILKLNPVNFMKFLSIEGLISGLNALN